MEMRDKARVATAVLIAAGLSGCVISSGHKRGPNGLPMYYLDGMTAGAALRKAEKYCPSGYKTIGTPKQTSPLDFVMVIECNPPGGAPTVAAAQRPSPAGFLVPLPVIDIAARCRELKESTGSSMVQVNCLEHEPPAQQWLLQRYTTSDIAVLCGRIAQKTRSFLAAKACVEQEEAAQATLPGVAKPADTQQGYNTWWEQQKASGKP